MAAKVFISYRAADGADKATALARELGRIFGDRAVFLDKDDLTAGRRWTDEVRHTLGTRPVVLLLVTPRLLSDGLDSPTDPVRQELTAALEAGAEVIPLLADGVEVLPPGLPPPLDALPERTWRRLRAYDWAADLARLTEDLKRLGVPPAGNVGHRRRLALLLGGGSAALVTFGAAAFWWTSQASDRLSGRWRVQVGSEPVILMQVERDGDRVTLESEPIDIRQRADWAEYRGFWRERFGTELDAVRYRGAGRWQRPAGSAAAVDLGFKIVSVPGDSEIDGGNLSATRQPDGRWRGTRWLNSAQAELPAEWSRR